MMQAFRVLVVSALVASGISQIGIDPPVGMIGLRCGPSDATSAIVWALDKGVPIVIESALCMVGKGN